jgi:transcriptional regulator with XRE-family HTH domain
LISKLHQFIINIEGELLMDEKKQYLIGLGNRIKSRRQELNMSQEELANKCGYKSRSTINKIELGINDVPQSKINAIASALDSTVGYIMGWTSEPHQLGVYEYDDDCLKETIEMNNSEEYQKAMELYTKYLALDDDGKNMIDIMLKKFKKSE